MSRKPPHPPDETAADLKVALRREHPELSDVALEALLTGPVPCRQATKHTEAEWYTGKRGKTTRGWHRRGRRVR